MSWAKFDDQVTFHPKIVEAGNAVVGLWMRMTTYACAQLTNGFVPDSVARMLGTTKELDKSVDSGLVDRVEGGYQVHDFLHHNLSADEVREKRRIRQQAGQSGGKQSGNTRRSKIEANASPEGEPETKHDASTKSNPLPSDPIPSEEKTNTPARVIEPSHPDYAWFHSRWCTESKALMTDPSGTKRVFELILGYVKLSGNQVGATCDAALAGYRKMVGTWDAARWSTQLFEKHWEQVQTEMSIGRPGIQAKIREQYE